MPEDGEWAELGAGMLWFILGRILFWPFGPYVVGLGVTLLWLRQRRRVGAAAISPRAGLIASGVLVGWQLLRHGRPAAIWVAAAWGALICMTVIGRVGAVKRRPRLGGLMGMLAQGVVALGAGALAIGLIQVFLAYFPGVDAGRVLKVEQAMLDLRSAMGRVLFLRPPVQAAVLAALVLAAVLMPGAKPVREYRAWTRAATLAWLGLVGTTSFSFFGGVQAEAWRTHWQARSAERSRMLRHSVEQERAELVRLAVAESSIRNLPPTTRSDLRALAAGLRGESDAVRQQAMLRVLDRLPFEEVRRRSNEFNAALNDELAAEPPPGEAAEGRLEPRDLALLGVEQGRLHSAVAEARSALRDLVIGSLFGGDKLGELFLSSVLSQCIEPYRTPRRVRDLASAKAVVASRGASEQPAWRFDVRAAVVEATGRGPEAEAPLAGAVAELARSSRSAASVTEVGRFEPAPPVGTGPFRREVDPRELRVSPLGGDGWKGEPLRFEVPRYEVPMLPRPVYEPPPMMPRRIIIR